MPNLFLAKSNPQQTIAAHTIDLLNEFGRLKKIYPNIPNLDWSLLKMACFYHDLGKMNTKFQNKILKAIGKNDQLLKDQFPHMQEINHGYLSCALIPLKKIENERARKVLIQAVFYHHTRLEPNGMDLSKIIKEDMHQYIDALTRSINQEFSVQGIEPFPINSPSAFFRNYTDDRMADKEYIMVKGLLNKIDHAASAGIAVEQKPGGLKKHLKDYFNRVLHSHPNQLQDYMQAHRQDNNIIVASTGIGKTEGALLWLGEAKGFFTLPLRVSINAIYQRIKGQDQLNYAAVGLLHSDTRHEYIEKNVYTTDYYEQTRQWSMPLTVCTLDQILDFVFKEPGFEQKLAILAYSKLIVDEIQMYSPKMLACLLIALKEISEMGGKFTIMTATLAPFVVDQLKALAVPFKMPDLPFYKQEDGQPMIRHCIQVVDKPISIETIVQDHSADKILVIVNTVKRAQALYQELKKMNKQELNNREVHLFHSRFIKSDRSKLEERILNDGKLTTKSRCIWITTQVVEASVDIDFDALYTELSDLSSLFQRMGRTFRNRVLTDATKANVIIFTGGEDYPSGINSGKRSVVDIDMFKLSKKALIAFATDCAPKIMTESDKMRLISETYTTANLRESRYFKDLKEYISHLKNKAPFEEEDHVVKNLREIFNQTIIPYQVYRAHQTDVETWEEQYKQTLHKGKMSENRETLMKARMDIQNKIQDLTVDIPIYRCKEAVKLNRFVDDIKLGDYLLYKIIDFPYDEEQGLRFTKEMGKFRTETNFL